MKFLYPPPHANPTHANNLARHEIRPPRHPLSETTRARRQRWRRRWPSNKITTCLIRKLRHHQLRPHPNPLAVPTSRTSSRRGNDRNLNPHTKALRMPSQNNAALHHLIIEFIGTTWSDHLGRPQKSFEEQLHAQDNLRHAQEGLNHHYPALPANPDQPLRGNHLNHRQYQLLNFAQTDVTSLLDMFGLMANVKRAKIHLPESLKGILSWK